MWLMDTLCGDLTYTARYPRDLLGDSREKALYALPWATYRLLL